MESTLTCHHGHEWEAAAIEKGPHRYELVMDGTCPICGGHAAKGRSDQSVWMNCGSLADCEIAQAVREGERASFFRRM